jgi:UDP-3-O-[3-hydroxymyristoyl] glucosamine N-acyltransferase
MVPLKTIAFVVNKTKPGAAQLAQALVEVARSAGADTRVVRDYPLPPGSLSGVDAACVIGGDGFGYRPEQTADGPRIVKIPHLGAVRIGHDVEIGCNACVDRGKFADTVIGNACKLDNLVQIGHNCVLGDMVLIAGASGIAGSVTIGDGAMLGGMVACKDHVRIGRGARLAGGAQIAGDVPDGGTYGGSPARPIREAIREVTALKKLPEALKRIPRAER